MAKKKNKVTVTHPFSSVEEHYKHLQKKYGTYFNERLEKLEEIGKELRADIN